MTYKHTKLPERIYVQKDADGGKDDFIANPAEDCYHYGEHCIEYIRADILDERDALIRKLVDALEECKAQCDEDLEGLADTSISRNTKRITHDPR